jgi:hypothetical protein
MLSASVPRNLRVRSSIQVASTRIPARAFLIAAGLIFVGGLMVVAGADIIKTVNLTGVMIGIGLAVFEMRCWGRSTTEVTRLLLRHARRRHNLRLEPRSITLPPETSAAPAQRRPRWQT